MPEPPAPGNTLTIGGAIADGTHADLPTTGLIKTGAGTIIGNSWNIINVSTLTETFNGTFSVVGFTRQGGSTGAGLWDGSANSAQYQFDTASGLLTVLPERSTWALLAFSLTTIMVLRRRRQS